MSARRPPPRRPVRREEVLDFETYEDVRREVRASAMAAKSRRRAHLGPNLTFLFENHETMRYQVLEMVRAERIVRESAIRHEIDTYNELLGGPGEIGASLLIEFDDPGERDRRLVEWRGLVERLYLRLPGGKKAYAVFDPRQVGDDRLSSVQYLKFDTGGETPLAVGSDFPALELERELDEDQRRALAEDLAEGLAGGPAGGESAPAPG